MTRSILTLDYCFDHMQQPNKPANSGQAGNYSVEKTMSIGGTSTNKSTMGKRPGKRPGRKPSKIDERAKLERSRQSARECRARKKLRYQYLEELVLNREKAVFALRDELETYKKWCSDVEEGEVPDDLREKILSEVASPSSPACPEGIIDFNFGRDVPDAHKEDT